MIKVKVSIYYEGMKEPEVFIADSWEDCLDDIFSSGIMMMDGELEVCDECECEECKCNVLVEVEEIKDE